MILNTPSSVERWVQFPGPSTFCAAVPNSTGAIGHLAWSGSSSLAANDLLLTIDGTLPPFVFGLLAASQVEASVPQAGGHVGTLCLGTPTGRGPVFLTDATGSTSMPIDATALPTANGIPAAALVGETWYFQAWHRDVVGGSPTANFTDALRVPWR